MALSKIKSTGIADGSVSTSSITDGTIVNADINASANIAVNKVSGAVSSTDITAVENNIALLGFKMAVNDGLTIFNLVDGVVDEFNDESGTDESEGSNDAYDSTDDFYTNTSPLSYSAGFAATSVTEPDTSTAGTNPTYGTITGGVFTVPTGMTTLNAKVWGSGGGTGQSLNGFGGGGGFSTGDIAVTPGQTIYAVVAEGGADSGINVPAGYRGGETASNTETGSAGGGGGGLGYVGQVDTPQLSNSAPTDTPNIYMIAGAGGGGGYIAPNPGNYGGGSGGGTQGTAGGVTPSAPRSQTNRNGGSGGGGSQSAGGQGGGTANQTGSTGAFLTGGSSAADPNTAGGGAGYYGGGGGGDNPPTDGSSGRHGGGGSSYIGNPQVSSGSTSQSSSTANGGGSDPDYGPSLNPNNEPTIPVTAAMGAGAPPSNPQTGGGSGYILLSGTGTQVVSSTIVSSTFTATSEPSTARIVVFQENVDTPTLNTDIIASVSRDGTNFSNATLSDSGYITGSSGQRILTGTVDVSGQPTGTSMRWKLALENNQVKIHGVSLQWK